MRCSKLVRASAALALAVLVGHVTDATTGQPLVNVKITVGSLHATTDARGAYRFPHVAPGHYTLSASSADVPLQHRSVTVTGQSAPTRLDLVLCSTTLDYSCAGAGPG
jgi:Carboxypeptidase regulatory-like domain